MEFQSFNGDYVRRLVEGDRSVQEHFAAYFGELLDIKLRRRVRSSDMIEEIRQETFARVLQALGQTGGLEQPERLGAFVNSVCNNVMLEGFRNGARNPQIVQEMDSRVDSHIDLDAPLINHERSRLVEQMLAELSKRDQELLRMVFLKEVDKAEACQRLGVGEEHFRVLLHRAKSRFRKRLARFSTA